MRECVEEPERVESCLLEVLADREADLLHLEDFLAAAVEMLRRFRRNPLPAFAGLPRTSAGLGVDPDG